MHQYEARQIKLRVAGRNTKDIPKNNPKVEERPNHVVKVLIPELVWPERRDVAATKAQYRPLPHPRQAEMDAFSNIRSLHT